MKKAWLFVLAVVLALLPATGCVDGATVDQVSRPVEEVEVEEELAEQDGGEADPALLELCRDLARDVKRVTVQTEATIYQDNGLDVRLTDQVMEEIFSMILGEPSRAEDREAVESLDVEDGMERISIRSSAGTAADEAYRSMELVQLSQDSALCPGGMMLQVVYDAEFPVYLYDSDIYSRISGILESNTYSVTYAMEGNYALLESSYSDMDHHSPGGRLLVNGTLLLEWKAYDGDEFTPDGNSGIIEALDPATGALLYETPVPRRTLKLEASDLEEWDYRIFFQDSVQYRKVDDIEVEYNYQLPPEVVASVGEAYEPLYDLDLDAGLLAWKGEDGVYLSDTDGGEARLVYADTDLEERVRQVDRFAEEPFGGFPVNYTHPIFFAGKLIAVGEMQGDDPMYVAMGIHDLESGETVYYMDIFSWLSGPPTPVGESSLLYWGREDLELLDVFTGERTPLDISIHDAASYDYQQIAMVEGTRDDEGYSLQQLVIYPLDHLEEKKILFTLSSYPYGMYIREVMEDYILCQCILGDGSVLVMIPIP